MDGGKSKTAYAALCLRAKMLHVACLPLRQGTNNTDQAQERSCQTSPLRIASGRIKAVLSTDGRSRHTFCLERQKPRAADS